MITKTHRKLPLVLAIATLALGAAHAGATADVNVTGRITPPSSECTLSVPREVQYGVIPLEKIHADSVTLLDKKGFAVKVRCDVPAKFVLRFTDTQSDTAVNDAAFLTEVAQTQPGIGRDEAFGLGVDSTGKKIGAMFLAMTRAAYMPTHGGHITSAYPIHQVAGQWTHNADGRVRGQVNYAFTGDLAIGQPVPVRTLLMDVDIVPALDSKHLDLARKIDVNGKLTVEISLI